MPAFSESSTTRCGFEWTQPNDAASGLLSFVRHPRAGRRRSLSSTSPRSYGTTCWRGYLAPEYWAERLNSDATEYGGSGVGNLGGVESHPLPNHAMPYSLTLRVPPLGCLVLEPQ